VASPSLFDRNRDVSSLSYPQVRPLFKWVYAWMFIGLLVTAVTAVFTANTPALLEVRANTGFAIGAIVAQFVIVIALSAAFQRLSPTMAAALFVLYAAVTGFSLSIIFLVFDIGSIAIAFGTTSILFGAMTMFGFTTDFDLTRIGNLLMMALLGLIIAMVVNIFVGWSFLNFIISLVGVAIFMGLTAYDTQNLKRLAAAPELQADGTLVAKYAIFGALQLYLDFINIFIFLLRLMSSND
jgi:uncharacterized protein